MSLDFEIKIFRMAETTVTEGTHLSIIAPLPGSSLINGWSI